MIGRMRNLFVALLTFSLLNCATSAPTNSLDAEQQVRAAERRWLDAYEQRDPVAMREILADDFVITYPGGEMQSKTDVVTMIERQRAADRPSPRFRTEEVKAHVYGDTVILTGNVVTIPGSGEEEVSRYTDTWVRVGGQWRVATSHLSNAPKKK